MMATKPEDRLLAVVRSQLGTTESPTGWTKYGSWWAKRHDKPASWALEPWCDMFLAWCADQAGLIDVTGDHAWTVGHAEWFKARGQWGHTPKKGAFVFFDWGGSRDIKRIDHIGIVEAVRGGTIVTIEGNAENRVKRRERSLANVAGFGYPAYLPAPAPAKPPAAPALTWTEKIVKELPTLRLGAGKSKTDPLRWHVKTAFYLLHARGFGPAGGADDTVFGEAVHDALRAFQRESGLKDDGVVGPKTWPALMRVA
ncbi:CHAP domain-containing protein [Nonomuraea angiospora]|uniref:CHAP domain-containing protein n=1 Tax=Nonomuraea angiospora TaxID=46172 RepID=UPI00344FCA83